MTFGLYHLQFSTNSVRTSRPLRCLHWTLGVERWTLHGAPASMKSFLKYWLPLLIWLGVMFVASGDLMSSVHTSRFLIPFMRWLKPDISPETLAMIHFFWRKSAHVSEYAILAVLLFRALRGGTRLRVAMPIFLIVWVGSTMFAALDEFHQSFVISRGAATGDVALDSCGAILGMTIYWWFTRQSRSGFQPL